MTESLDFSLAIIEIPVTGPDGKSYILKEATGKAANAYRNRALESTEFQNGRPVSVKGLASLESFLISMCLFDEKNKPVPQSVIESWPARVQKKLFEKVKEISDLGEQATTAKDALEDALKREDSPVPLTDFQKWVRSLGDEKYKPLLELIEEEPAKNAQDTAMGG